VEHLRVVVVGDLEPTRRVCSELRGLGHAVVHLLRPSDEVLAAHLAPGTGSEDRGTDAVAVVVRGDVVALRYALLTEHLRPRVRLVVTVFDRTVGEQLVRTIPNCVITSPAEVAVPSIIAGCLGDDVLTVDTGARPIELLRRGPAGPTSEAWHGPKRRPRLLLRRLTEQLRSTDDSARMMVLGMAGLTAVLLSDATLRITALHQDPADAVFASAHALATVGVVGGLDDPTWYRLVASAFVLLTIALTAIFTAGVVDRLASARPTSLVGRRTIPVRDHVVVIGLGQVGLRLCLQLKAMGIRVLAVERDRDAPNLRHTRAAGIPVLIGNAADRQILNRMSLTRARALAAMGSDDLDNVEAIIAARAVAPTVRMVLRAGEGDIVRESRSLFRIAQVRDVSGLTAAVVTRALVGSGPTLAYQRGDEIRVVIAGQDAVAGGQGACSCR
jgi:Trk K+ transport system NAD-binding subunit